MSASASDIELLLFKNLEQNDIDRWLAQNICLHPGSLYLTQRNGGPCGVLASIQGFLLLHSIFELKSPQDALIDAMLEIIQRSSTGKIYLVGRNNQTVLQENLQQTRKGIIDAEFDKDSGVVRFVKSVLASRSAQQVRSDMDDSLGCLTGRFGHCGQEMLNLLLTGKATSQMHDGNIKIEGGLELRGVTERPRIGFLTHLEALRLTKVGAYLKNPIYPIWVIGSESHFTVLYSTDLSCDLKNHAQEALEQGRRAFHQIDHNETGFMEFAQVEQVLKILKLEELELKSKIQVKCEESGGILLFHDFWEICGRVVRNGGKMIAGEEASKKDKMSWSCAMCTYVNPLSHIKCEMCEGPKPMNVREQKPEEYWHCSACTFVNGAPMDFCTMCGVPRPLADMDYSSSKPQIEKVDELEPGARRLELFHVNGLLDHRVLNDAQVVGPIVSKVILTTMDPACLQAAHQAMTEDPFEETAQTKWLGCLLEYPSGKSPNIKG